jgi:chromosome partitioning protein
VQTRYITIANSKGGVAKSTTVLALAYLLSVQGYKVLVVDLDVQMNASLSLGIIDSPSLFNLVLDGMPFKDVIQPSQYSNLDVVPAAVNLLNFPNTDLRWLRQLVRDVPYDFVFFDTSPALAHLTVLALVAANHLIIPTTPHVYAREGIHTLIGALATLRRDVPDTATILGVLLTIVDTAAGSSLLTANLKMLLGDMVFKTEIPYNRKLLRLGLDKNIFEEHPQSAASRAYKKFCAEFLNRLNPYDPK